MRDESPRGEGLPVPLQISGAVLFGINWEFHHYHQLQRAQTAPLKGHDTIVATGWFLPFLHHSFPSYYNLLACPSPRTIKAGVIDALISAVRARRAVA